MEPLGKIISFQKIADPRGNLTVVEQCKDIPFNVSRVYWTYDIPTDAERGGHAHIHCRELIVSVSGAFTVTLDDGSQRQQYLLSKPYEGLLVDTRIWRTLENFSSGAVCLVLAEDPFDESDYIYDYSDFLRYKNKNIDSPTSKPSENV
jgi:WxcM-like, C-terminal.